MDANVTLKLLFYTELHVYMPSSIGAVWQKFITFTCCCDITINQHTCSLYLIHLLFFLSRMTLLLGPPGSGKSTLLLALAGKLDPNLKVSSWWFFSPSFFGEYHKLSRVWNHISLLVCFAILHHILFD